MNYYGGRKQVRMGFSFRVVSAVCFAFALMRSVRLAYKYVVANKFVFLRTRDPKKILNKTIGDNYYIYQYQMIFINISG